MLIAEYTFDEFKLRQETRCVASACQFSGKFWSIGIKTDATIIESSS
jgi:hypothetical protein